MKYLEKNARIRYKDALIHMRITSGDYLKKEETATKYSYNHNLCFKFHEKYSSKICPVNNCTYNHLNNISSNLF